MKTYFLLILFLLICCGQSQIKSTESMSKSQDSISSDSAKYSKINLKEFFWQEDRCYYSGMYYSKQIKYNQLNNSRELFYYDYRFEINSKYLVNYIEEIPQLNLDSLDCECTRILKDLDTIEILNSKYFIDLKRNLTITTTMKCNFGKLMIQAYNDPNILRSIKTQDSCDCNMFINGLINGDEEVLKIWADLVQNKNYKYIYELDIDNYSKYSQSKDRFKCAKLFVIRNIWRNCIEKKVPYRELYNKKFHEEFVKYLYDIKENCPEE